MQLDHAPPPKHECLFINAEPLPRYPHPGCIVIELVEEMLNLPQRILCGLLLGIFAEVKDAHKMLEVLPTLKSGDRLLTVKHLLVHCLQNEFIAKDIVVLEPHLKQ